MEVSMKRSGIACCEKVFEYAMPVEQAAETVVPDTMPDVERRRRRAAWTCGC